MSEAKGMIIKMYEWQLSRKLERVISSNIYSPTDTNNNKIFFQKGNGAYIYDYNDKEYIDFNNGKGSILLGHNDEEVNHSIIKLIKENKGTLTGPHKYILELTDLILESLPENIKQVTFFSTGTEAVRAARFLAKDITNKPYVLSAGYHGWDSIWKFSGSLLEPNENGIIDFFFSINLLKEALKKYENKIAAIIISPELTYVEKSVYKELFKLAKESGILIICDDVKQGFRYERGSSLNQLDLEADLYTFSKGLSNGKRLSVLVGSERHMKNSFGYSYTAYYEPITYISAIATMKKMIRLNGYEEIKTAGDTFIERMSGHFEKYNLPIEIQGNGNLFQFIFEYSDLENDFYENATQQGVLFFKGDNQCPSLALTDEIYSLVEKRLIFVLEKLSENYKEYKGNRISERSRFYRAWAQMDGAASIFNVDEIEEIRKILRI
ncbi:aminotransferase class III-fold pyridoxal phosphate-dependent enzyme [Virgibacillus pantothenticus]|uniref:aminotransferase class III-fold pyridoxal phosphate-dependent enzyme n=1 Tax=Virgibacillus pantothenticus TaxID=1473 RepID=UPI0014806FBD|nr:aminotransferase class III-fold pyridoxal phosphate-dependent enzyme [Virgibacillus pantothenticus]